jgi:hypothetical protein
VAISAEAPIQTSAVKPPLAPPIVSAPAPTEVAALPASASATAGAESPLNRGDRADFRCFGWAHERDFSTDCYRSQQACLDAARKMSEGARLPGDCGPRAHASCTTLSGGEERCFGDTANCGRYRAFVGRNHLVTTACVELP